DLLTELREARPLAPAELREHVRRIAEAAAPERRSRLTWRRALVVAVPVAAAVVGAALLVPGGKRTAQPPASYELSPPVVHKAAGADNSLQKLAPSSAAAPSNQTALPAPAPNRVQRITTSLQLRLPNTQAVSDATKQAVAITRSLGGYPKA